MKIIIKFLPFILINILVSAATTMTVLWFWEKNERKPSGASVSMASDATGARGWNQSEEIVRPTVTLPPLKETNIRIENVFGVGDVDNEVVLLTYMGESELNLAGWRLYDAGAHYYTFPDVWLAKDGSIQVYSRAGNDSALELFWGLKDAVWQTGEIVQLLDYEGNERAIYQIP